DVLSDPRCVDAGVLGVNLPKLGMVLDALVKSWLGDGGVIHFAVAVAAVADEVDNHITAKRCAILGGHLPNAHDSVGIFSVHMENGNRLALNNVRGKARRMLLVWRRCEADEIVDDDVDCAADGVRAQVREIEGLRPNPLASESGVPMHHDGNDFVKSFLRAVHVGAAQPVARLLGARAPNSYGIDSFEMARI